ncbi:enoyl-CoA hydratase/isomerase family protein [Pseudomonas fluorescens]|uniref:Fatty acid oxidation complex subunit alpha n=1 Tax=Pseudomonas fluorescens TaxID=294 RepID=A0A5E7Q382_PSEFL|nr:enoyl-CoA hydratase/isomerase family protein [Pseudomonas fluorescens]VVP55347.1 Fatty acid oxidation complex subunit alpha [Pseudomonas fluorescens]
MYRPPGSRCSRIYRATCQLQPLSIHGRATGVGSELALASDMRFASREKAILSQWEIGAALVPEGGPMARLPQLMGRGRPLEVLLTGNDINDELAERYGYVNRALPDAEFDKFVDTMARRIARFNKQSIADSCARRRIC